MEQKCLKCGRVLFKKVLLDEKGHMAMDVNTPLDLESDDNEQFFRCPHCSAKNIVLSSTDPDGLPGLTVSHIKE